MLIRKIRYETAPLLLVSLPPMVERFWSVVATKHKRSDKCSCTFLLPLEEQDALNDTLLNFMGKYPVMSIADNQRVVDCIVGSPCELSDRRHLSRMLQAQGMARTLPTMLDDAHLHDPWTTEWTLKQRALFARDPTDCDRPWRGLLELRSLWEEFERLGKAALYTTLEMAFFETMNSLCVESNPAEALSQINRNLTVYFAHAERLDASEGVHAVLAAFLGICRLLMSTKLTREELSTAWSRLDVVRAHTGLRDPIEDVGGTTDAMKMSSLTFALRVAQVLGSDMYMGPNHLCKHNMIDIARRARIREPDFLLDLENMEAFAKKRRKICFEDQKLQVFRTVPPAKVSELLTYKDVVGVEDIWKRSRPELLGSVRDLLVQHTPVGIQDRVSSRNVVMRNMPLGLIEALRQMDGPDGDSLRLYICAIVLQQVGSILNMFNNECVLYHGLLRSKLVRRAQDALAFGLWSERIKQLALTVNQEHHESWLTHVLDLMAREYRRLPAEGTALFDTDFYANCTIQMRTAVEAGLIVLRLVDNTEWGQRAADDLRRLNEFLVVIDKKVSFRQVPSPFWKTYENEASAAAINAVRVYENALNLAVTTKFPLLDMAVADGSKTKPEGGLPTDQKLPTVARPSNKFPIRLQRGHTCASRCERFVFGELTTTSVRFS